MAPSLTLFLNPLLRSGRVALICTAWLVGVVASASPTETEISGVPLVVGNRTIHTFRSALGDFSAEERAVAARAHIHQAIETGGEGWTSIAPTEHGIVVAIDGQPMFTVALGDAQRLAGETPEALANAASRTLQKVWAETRAHRQPGIPWSAWAQVGSALAVLILLVGGLVLIARVLRKYVIGGLANRLKDLSTAGFGARFSGTLLRLAATSTTVALWLLGLLATFACISYSLGQFAITRPFSENLMHALREAVLASLRSAAAALPGVFVAVLIFAGARLLTLVSRAVFDNISAGRMKWGALDAHTAPAARYLVNVAIWLFAVAMSYPYLPGSQTEAFKGLSVLMGLMVSIGAAGPVGQIASGLILAFTRAVKVGEFVRIQDCEGTVTQLGLCVTRLRTGIGEEIALPNSLVMSSVTRNSSRLVPDGGGLIETAVTIGYDTPWRQVHALLQEAAAAVPALRRDPAPFVVQRALSDFYVDYRLVVQIGPEATSDRLRVLSDLHAAIQDVFNRHGVQIMSPHYEADPATNKVVPESHWHGPPAAPAKKQS